MLSRAFLKDHISDQCDVIKLALAAERLAKKNNETCATHVHVQDHLTKWMSCWWVGQPTNT